MTRESPRRPSREDAERARRRAEVFGDVVPESTSDDRDVDDTRVRDAVGDEWLRDNVPPHHGG